MGLQGHWLAMIDLHQEDSRHMASTSTVLPRMLQIPLLLIYPTVKCTPLTGICFCIKALCAQAFARSADSLAHLQYSRKDMRRDTLSHPQNANRRKAYRCNPPDPRLIHTRPHSSRNQCVSEKGIAEATNNLAHIPRPLGVRMAVYHAWRPGCGGLFLLVMFVCDSWRCAR